MISRQLAYQYRHRRLGLCILCARPRHPGSKVYCPKHLVERRIARQAVTGCRPWREGDKGRRPLDVPRTTNPRRTT